MKLVRSFIIALLLLAATNIFAADVRTNYNIVSSDSVNLLAEFSLFYEAHRNKQFDDWTLEKGWNVINGDPTQFVKYKIFTRMEEILFALHDAETTSEEMKANYADQVIKLYDKAVEYDQDLAGYYLVKKAYVLETWYPLDIPVVVEAYKAAFEKDPSLDDVYKDRLGQIYQQNDMIEEAFAWYDKLSSEDPTNERWNQRLAGLVETPEELLEILVKSWKNNPDNIEKAWKVGSQAVRVQDYEQAKEAFVFLTTKAPDVINYWKQIATVYDKLGETDNSLSAYKTLIELQPENRDNYVNIALVYKKLNQLSVSRSYLKKAANADPDWDYPYYIEGSLYEQAARNCMQGKLEFMDKCVFLLAVETYSTARAKGGASGSSCAERISSLSPTIPTQEDYFFRGIKSGDKIKIEGNCYDWIGRSVTAKF